MDKRITIFISFLIAYSFCHSYVTSPITRGNQAQTQSGCRGPTCLGPCDKPASQASGNPTTIQRGQSLPISWPRNNHAGGFVRYSWTQTANSDNAQSFNDGAQKYACFEKGGCVPGDPNNPNGGDPANPLSCQDTVTVPGHLTDGTWTLQWVWFGGAFALGDYYSCMDFRVSGGPASAKPTPFFQGGDYSNPNSNVCKYFTADRIGRCPNEPCTNPTGEKVGVPFGVTSSSTSPSGTSSSSGSSSSGSSGTSTSSGGSSTSSSGSNLCPNPNAPNIDGELLYPPKCGPNAPTARCADGQCCSTYGYCGPVKNSDGLFREDIYNNGTYFVVSPDVAFGLYCTNNKGDWRLIPCGSATNSPTSSTSSSTGSDANSSSPASSGTFKIEITFFSLFFFVFLSLIF